MVKVGDQTLYLLETSRNPMFTLNDSLWKAVKPENVHNKSITQYENKKEIVGGVDVSLSKTDDCVCCSHSSKCG